MVRGDQFAKKIDQSLKAMPYHLLLRTVGKFGRKYPFIKGTYFLAHRSPLKHLSRIKPLSVKLRNGVCLTVDPADFNGRVTAIFGLQEPVITKICKDYLQPNDIFLDIGANNGVIGLNCVKSAFEIHMFEPQPDLCINIQNCIDEQKIENVQIHSVGLMDSEGMLDLHVVDQHSGAASFMRSHQGKTVQVPIKDISTFIPPILKGRPFSAKIDVEGAERYILSSLLELPNMRFIIFECQSMYDELWKVIKGYKVFGIGSTWTRPKFRRITNSEEMKKYEDFFIQGDYFEK